MVTMAMTPLGEKQNLQNNFQDSSLFLQSPHCSPHQNLFFQGSRALVILTRKVWSRPWQGIPATFSTASPSKTAWAGNFYGNMTRENALGSRALGEEERRNKAIPRKLLEEWGARSITLKQSFLTFEGASFFALGGCPVHCRMLRSTHDLHPPDAIAFSCSCDNQKGAQSLHWGKCTLSVKLPLIENHWFRANASWSGSSRLNYRKGSIQRDLGAKDVLRLQPAMWEE